MDARSTLIPRGQVYCGLFVNSSLLQLVGVTISHYFPPSSDLSLYGWWDRDQRPQTFVHISGRSGGYSARRLVFGRPKATELAMRKKVNGLLTGDVEALIQATMASRIRDSFQQTWQHVFFEVDVLFVLQKSWWQRRYVGWVDGFPFKLSRLRTFP